MLPNPRYFDKNRGSGYLARRTSLILRRMGGAELPVTEKPPTEKPVVRKPRVEKSASHAS
jgi:monofunctional biosynthetic peptidoglycan transglycosylase